MNTDYTQPFYIGGSKGKWPDRYNFYLPALEESEMDLGERLEILEGQVSLLRQVKLTPKQNDTINQLKAGYIHLTRKIDEVIAYRKRKQKVYKEYE